VEQHNFNQTIRVGQYTLGILDHGSSLQVYTVSGRHNMEVDIREVVTIPGAVGTVYATSFGYLLHTDGGVTLLSKEAAMEISPEANLELRRKEKCISVPVWKDRGDGQFVHMGYSSAPEGKFKDDASFRPVRILHFLSEDAALDAIARSMNSDKVRAIPAPTSWAKVPVGAEDEYKGLEVFAVGYISVDKADKFDKYLGQFYPKYGMHKAVKYMAHPRVSTGSETEYRVFPDPEKRFDGAMFHTSASFTRLRIEHPFFSRLKDYVWKGVLENTEIFAKGTFRTILNINDMRRVFGKYVPEGFRLDEDVIWIPSSSVKKLASFQSDTGIADISYHGVNESLKSMVTLSLQAYTRANRTETLTTVVAEAMREAALGFRAAMNTHTGLASLFDGVEDETDEDDNDDTVERGYISHGDMFRTGLFNYRDVESGVKLIPRLVKSKIGKVKVPGAYLVATPSASLASTVDDPSKPMPVRVPKRFAKKLPKGTIFVGTRSPVVTPAGVRQMVVVGYTREFNALELNGADAAEFMDCDFDGDAVTIYFNSSEWLTGNVNVPTRDRHNRPETAATGSTNNHSEYVNAFRRTFLAARAEREVGAYDNVITKYYANSYSVEAANVNDPRLSYIGGQLNMVIDLAKHDAEPDAVQTVAKVSGVDNVSVPVVYRLLTGKAVKASELGEASPWPELEAVGNIVRDIMHVASNLPSLISSSMKPSVLAAVKDFRPSKKATDLKALRHVWANLGNIGEKLTYIHQVEGMAALGKDVVTITDSIKENTLDRDGKPSFYREVRYFADLDIVLAYAKDYITDEAVANLKDENGVYVAYPTYGLYYEICRAVISRVEVEHGAAKATGFLLTRGAKNLHLAAMSLTPGVKEALRAMRVEGRLPVDLRWDLP